MGQELDILFTHGQSEAIDAKLLPNGLFSSLTNLRYRKDGRLVSRYGIRLNSAQFNIVTGIGYGGIELPSGGSVHFGYPANGSAAHATWVYVPNDSAKQAVGYGANASQLGRARRFPVANAPTNVTACDMGYLNNCPIVAFCETSASANGAHDARFNEDFSASSTGTQSVTQADFGGTSASNIKVVVVSSVQVCYLYWDGANIRIRIVTTSGTGFSTSVTDSAVVAPFAGGGPLFDACAGPSGTIGLVYQTGALVLTMATLTVPGLVLTARATVAVANLVRPCVAFNGASTYQTTWADGATFSVGNVSKQQWTTAGLSGGTTSLDASGNVSGYPTVGWIASQGQFYSTWTNNSAAANAEAVFECDYQGGAFGATIKAAGMVIVSRPFDFASAAMVIVADGVKGGFGTYHVYDLDANATVASVAADAAVTGAAVLASNLMDTRRSVVAMSPAVANTPYPGIGYIACALPVVINSARVTVDVVRFETGLFGLPARCPVVTPSGAIFPGPFVVEHDGYSATEAGLGHGPEVLNVTTAAGAIPAGTYQYTAIYEWLDAKGRRVLSPPVPPVTVTPGVAWTGTARIPNYAYGGIKWSGGSTTLSSVRARLYRTKAGESIFYYVGSVGTSNIGSTFVTITDTSLDATIGANEILYTQGVRGGLSGLAEYDPPPACGFMWCGNNRVIAGGLEDPYAVQWSKLFYPGEPVHWTSLAQWRSQINGEVTGVAALDGIWYVGTKDAIWAIGGDGPDDSGSGSFTDPVKLPSDTGFASQRSIVETQDGLMFQGKNGGIYLLPRGAGAPTWVGQTVRDTLTAYPFISSAVLVQKENCVYWACTDATGATGVLVVYDTRIKEWYVDSYYARAIYSLSTHQGNLVIDGRHRQTPGLYVDDDTGAKTTAIAQVWVTGDVRPFGPNGWGRVRRSTLLSEYRGPCKVVLEESVDAGQTWQTGQQWTHYSGTPGAELEDEYRLPIVRTDALRFRGTITPTDAGGTTTPSEALAMSALSLECFPADGPSRQPAANVR